MDGNTFSFTEMYPAGFTPQFVGEKDQAFGVVGFKGDLAENLTFDVSGSISKQRIDHVDVRLAQPDLWSADSGHFEFGTLIQEETVVNTDFVWSVEAGLPSPLTVGFGAEYREETYEATEGDEQSYGIGPYITQPLYVQTSPGVYAFDSTVSMAFPGASGYGGTSPDAANAYSQHSYAAYASVEADLTESFSVGVGWPLRGLQHLRLDHGRQAECAVGDRADVFATRHGRHRLSRAVAGPEQRADPDHRVHQRCAGTDGHLSGHQSDRAIFRCHRAQA